ncbi:carboxymuconolactone decarboxylase family protein [Pseudomaricurvus alkylphenolicus]|uniref:carboxymuconolactone decarboxylase family protein n=1 Tax=Pseudomaricurvus alkylphenolicus TaxID=1306991 RepID=UPI00142236E9|nr:carboxymuconolactone decarboxylase family protein [Pseudomaricurvus alkylphenolicus]NIB44088.1 carboxymuconolactone decarboxylase family protein [Pseudomaricurvus alkylphenolicus]
MPRVTPIPKPELPNDLADAVDRGLATGVLSTSLPVQVWSHRPAVAKAWLSTLQALHDTALLSDRERELVRLRISAVTQCKACQVARKSDAVSDEDIACLDTNNARFSARERAALSFAEQFTTDHTGVGDADFVQLRLVFSEAEVVELNLFCALMLAGGRMTYVQQAY